MELVRHFGQQSADGLLSEVGSLDLDEPALGIS